MVTIALLLVSLLGGESQDERAKSLSRARAAMALAADGSTTGLTYEQARQQALKTGSDLLVFIGCKNTKGKRPAIVCEVAALEGYPAKCVVLARPSKDGYLYALRLYDEKERLLEVYGQVVSETKEVQPSAPFFVPSPGKTAPPDGRGGSAGPRFHQGHSCPNCGAEQRVVHGPGPVPNTHTHRCDRCQTIWFH